ncbi:putative porin [Chryseobacterium sp.]|uniref:putative porin n=1 Tax=Chryseobacterium sp. TaxID=1871047 RepID=UPI0011CAD935|nr:putative porin [Chryseobacterium sp.]TXF76231.1 hypothetical protein FUA25_10105 [Chryseobacterium sp.]
MKYVFLVVFLSFAVASKAQVVNKTDSVILQSKQDDSLVIDSGIKDSLKIFKPTIDDYKFQTQFSEKKVFDTVLSPDKTYIFSQYNNKDNFGKQRFSNIGSGFNPLVFEVNPEQNLSLLPTNKSFGILGITDIKYYDVKTPTTTFIYHNAVKNGAALNTTYTQNIGKNFNFALEYFGLRSQGNFRNALSANNNTLFSGHFISKNSRYEAFAHYLHQNVNNQENGGIVDDALYLSGDDTFNNKYNVEVNLLNSNSQFSYRRYYFSQQFTPFNSEKFPFKIRHTIFHQGNKYYYNQTSPESYWVDSDTDLVVGYPYVSEKYSKNLSNTFSLVFDNEKFKLDAGFRHQMIKLGVENPLTVNAVTVPGELKENRIGAVGNLGIFLWDKINLNSFLEISRGKEFGNYIRSANKLRFEPVKNYFVDAKVNFQSASPSFNYLMNTSVYKKFNYFLEDPQNETIMEIGGNINLNWFKSQLFASYFRIDNFTYLNATGQPNQSQTSTNISQIGGNATFDYRKFHLNTRVLFQNALTNKELYPMPNFVGRANLYYQTKAFKNAAEIQTGIKVNYFTKFASRDYFPVLNEFILPNPDSFSIGGQPVVDVYFNMKVKKMFIFIEGQHMAELFSNNKVYSAPHYPFYDFRLNIGIVWYLFS